MTAVLADYFYVLDEPSISECVDCGRIGAKVLYSGPATILDGINIFCLDCWITREEFFLEEGSPLWLGSCDHCWMERVTEKYKDAAVMEREVELCGNCRDLIVKKFTEKSIPTVMPLRPFDNGIIRVETPHGPGICFIRPSRKRAWEDFDDDLDCGDDSDLSD